LIKVKKYFVLQDKWNKDTFKKWILKTEQEHIDNTFQYRPQEFNGGRIAFRALRLNLAYKRIDICSVNKGPGD
jgi:hypothetical protein